MNAPFRLQRRAITGLPGRARVGLRPQHCAEIIETSPCIAFFEIHAENYMGAGGPPHRMLERIRARYPVSVHGVGLSIGRDQPLDGIHLGRVKRLVHRYAPAAFSEHLAWSSHDAVFLKDLLPDALRGAYTEPGVRAHRPGSGPGKLLPNLVDPFCPFTASTNTA
jgi:uncharacterized protein (UPF0276 family)